MEIPYDESKKDRDKIIKEREKRLYQSFENMRKQIDEKIQTMNFSTVSERVKRQQLEEIRNELQKHLQEHYNALESGLKDDMVKMGESVLKESESFYAGLKMPIGMSITSFPVEIMNNVVNGSVYNDKWYLSKALWGDYTEKIDQINEVVSNGIGLNLSSLEIAKQLEQYVDPSAMTPSKTIVTHCLQDPVTGKLYSQDYVKRHPEKEWSGFKEKDSRFRYGKVDYNAQRLARTLVSHAYQQNVVQQAKANPFATGVKWLASGGERMCEICEERDGKIFPADDVPLDHPNGMCTFEVVTDLSMMEMSDVLADWVNGEPTEYDDRLYDWYNNRAVKPEQKPAKKEERLNYAKLREERVLERREKIVVDFDNAPISEVEEYAKQKLNTYIDFRGASDAARRGAVKSLYRFEKEGGSIGDTKIVFGGTKGLYGYFDPKTDTIHLRKNDSFVEKIIEENVRSMFKLGKPRFIDPSYEGVAAHEIGHAFDRYFNQDISREIARRGLLAKAFSISSYAATEPAYGSPRASEAVAENISAYLAGGEMREKIDKDVVVVLEEYFKKAEKK